MNERIKELAGQCGFNTDTMYPGGFPNDHTLVLLDFAELIVKECLSIASEVRGEPASDTHFVIGYDRACEKIIDGIKEHFGVQE